MRLSKPRSPRVAVVGIPIDHAAALVSMRVAWLAEGETLLAGPEVPTRAMVMKAAARVCFAAVHQHASISAGAKLMKTSRRAWRDTLKFLGVYVPPAEVPRGWAIEASPASSDSIEPKPRCLVDSPLGKKPVLIKGVLGFDPRAWVVIGRVGKGWDGKVPVYLLDGSSAGSTFRALSDVKGKLIVEAGKARRQGRDGMLRIATQAEIKERYRG